MNYVIRLSDDVSDNYSKTIFSIVSKYKCITLHTVKQKISENG